MNKDDFNSEEFTNFIANIVLQAKLRKSASDLADWLAETFEDETILEFICWVFDRLGNQHDKDANDMALKFAVHFNEHYNKIDSEIYHSADDFCNGIQIIFADDFPDLSGEWDESDGSDDSSLWEELDDDFKGGD